MEHTGQTLRLFWSLGREPAWTIKFCVVFAPPQRSATRQTKSCNPHPTLFVQNAFLFTSIKHGKCIHFQSSVIEKLCFSFKREREENYFKPLWTSSGPSLGNKGPRKIFQLNTGIQNSQIQQICKQEKSWSQTRNENILNIWEPLFQNVIQWNSISQDTPCQIAMWLSHFQS